MTDSPEWDVELLSRLWRADVAFQHRLRDIIPDGIHIKDGLTTVKPEDPGYNHIYNRFCNDICSRQSAIILTFLYQYDIYLSKNIDIFEHSYKELFKSRYGKWETIIENFPKLDQSSLSVILNTMSETLISSRLEKLTEIGVIKRSNTMPPRPKYITITPLGKDVVRKAIDESVSLLQPLFTGHAVKATKSGRKNSSLRERAPEDLKKGSSATHGVVRSRSARPHRG